MHTLVLSHSRSWDGHGPSEDETALSFLGQGDSVAGIVPHRLHQTQSPRRNREAGQVFVCSCGESSPNQLAQPTYNSGALTFRDQCTSEIKTKTERERERGGNVRIATFTLPNKDMRKPTTYLPVCAITSRGNCFNPRKAARTGICP